METIRLHNFLLDLARPALGLGALVTASLYLVSFGNKGSYCARTDDVENNETSGSDTVKPMATRATRPLVLSSQLRSALLLIAESWLERGDERLEVRTEGFIELEDGGRKDEGNEAGVREMVAH
ncbi:hypothetical protein Q5P01_015169 [Channa striata]|uniref:Uncharacterized protein n=1 Tax=Channa striata TaxID=64152 RepID=A0AA88MLF3_CHASR|nr:hypothetical protein Q5P01_015169 [Channa striata]